MARAGPLILDFDRSVLPLPSCQRLSLGHWQENVRFGCRLNVLEDLAGEIAPVLIGHTPVFLGSGDFHHISYPLIQRQAGLGEKLQVVVFDNHPDNMRYPFGIHCGSWVSHVANLPFVACVHVLGITSADVAASHAWENRWQPLRTGRVRYWCVGAELGWMKHLGMAGSRSFDSVANLLDAFAAHIGATSGPIYLSIDKDVLSKDDAHTNWDQGVMRMDELDAAVRFLLPRLTGADVTGELSNYRYQSRFKRLLRWMDGQQDVPETDLARWQVEHQRVNLQLLSLFNS